MKMLVANYVIELESPIIVKQSEKAKLHYKVKVDSFDVSIRLSSMQSSKSKLLTEKYYTVPYSSFIVTVGRPDIQPPPVIPDEKGRKDYSVQRKYFSERAPKYRKVAAEIINRAIRYFKYRLGQPLLFEIREKHQSLMNVFWTDKEGREAGKGTATLMVKAIPGMDNHNIGTKSFKKKHDKAFVRALESPVIPTLSEEIAYDAQSAIYLDNFRRAVLELALSTEIAVKQTLFGTTSTGSLVFEYLEDKGKINVRVIELIDTVALQAFGSSFKTTNPNDFKNIDHLFRCRNKVAHRGEPVFKDDKGKLHKVDLKIVKAWWKSIEKLKNWLKKCS